MMQLLNNLWVFLNTENTVFLERLGIIMIPIENYLFMSLFLIILNVSATRKQKLSYVISMTLISIVSSKILLAPFNVIINYACVIFLIKFIFKLNLLKSFISLVISVFILSLVNILLQNPYLTVCNISFETYVNTPIYRITYLIILYTLLYILCLLLKNFQKAKFTLDLLDTLDKKTLMILTSNLIVGFITLCIQLFITQFYIDIVPLIITLLSVVSLISFFMISLYSFSRVIKLALTKRDLQNAEEYNNSLQILYDEVKGFKHDFDNIMSTFNGYLANNDLAGAKSYFIEVKKDCKITNDLSILNPSIINNPGIYSLLNNKYFRASELGITMNLEYFIDLNSLKIDIYRFSRILGILIDNAIEAASQCEEKMVRVIFRRENRHNRNIIIVENTYSNKDVDIEKIFEKSVSGKENHSGIGLWEVKKYVNNSKNINLITTKNDKLFTQRLEIYDEDRSVV